MGLAWKRKGAGARACPEGSRVQACTPYFSRSVNASGSPSFVARRAQADQPGLVLTTLRRTLFTPAASFTLTRCGTWGRLPTYR